MSFLGAKKLPYFRKTMDEICRIPKGLEEKYCMDDVGSSSKANRKIHDLMMAKTKGAPRASKNVSKKRHCSTCSMIEHTKRNCPMVNGKKSLSNEHEVSYGDGIELDEVAEEDYELMKK